VYFEGAEIVTPSSRNDGLPLRLIRRLSEKTTSADVSAVPSANFAFFFSWNVNVFASAVAFHEETRSGIGWATSLPLYVNSVS
jgi:hypothetical protein